MAHKDFKDLHGKVFNRLTVLSYHGQDKRKKSLWRCSCICGKYTVVQGSAILSGHTRSCGCFMREKRSHITHGDSKAKLYGVWESMRARCSNPKDTGYKDYGGRGIKVCKVWQDSYIEFKKWALSNGHLEGLSIERINVHGNYEPENCCWITMKDQARNKTTTAFCSFFGEKISVMDLADRCEISAGVIRQRAKKGWKDDLLTMPLRTMRGKTGREKILQCCKK